MHVNSAGCFCGLLACLHFRRSYYTVLPLTFAVSAACSFKSNQFFFSSWPSNWHSVSPPRERAGRSIIWRCFPRHGTESFFVFFGAFTCAVEKSVPVAAEGLLDSKGLRLTLLQVTLEGARTVSKCFQPGATDHFSLRGTTEKARERYFWHSDGAMRLGGWEVCVSVARLS